MQGMQGALAKTLFGRCAILHCGSQAQSPFNQVSCTKWSQNNNKGTLVASFKIESAHTLAKLSPWKLPQAVKSGNELAHATMQDMIAAAQQR